MIFFGQKISIESLAQRHLTILGAGICFGYVFRVVSPGPVLPGLAGLFADTMLAVLLLAGALFIKWSQVARQYPDFLRLTVISIPLLITLLTLVGVIMMPLLSLLSASILAIAIIIGGAPSEHKIMLYTDLPSAVRSLVFVQGPATLVLALLLALGIEVAAGLPAGSARFSGYLALFMPAASFATGAASALIAVRLMPALERCKRAGPGKAVAATVDGRAVRARKQASQSPQAVFLSFFSIKKNVSISLTSSKAALIGVICSAVFAVFVVVLFGGVSLIAVAAVGLIWSESGKIPEELKQGVFYKIETRLAPVTYALFGFVFGPHILGADMVVILFAFGAVTLLRFLSRFLALSMSPLSTGGVIFVAFARGAPGVSSALYLLHLYDSPILIDTEQLLSIGGLCLFWGAVISRLSVDYSIGRFLRYHKRLKAVTDRHIR